MSDDSFTEPQLEPISKPMGAHANLFRRASDWAQQQPWYPLVRSTDPEVRAEGLRLKAVHWEAFQRECDVDGKRWLAVKQAEAQAADTGAMEVLGIEPLLAQIVRRPDHTDALDAARKWLNGTGPKSRILVLSGQPGTGKTVAAAWAVKQWSGLFMRHGAFARAKFDVPTMLRLEAARLVCIDDVYGPGGDGKGYSEGALVELVEVRLAMANGSVPARTVLTTNVAWDELVTNADARIIDRIKGCGHWVRLSGTSLRGRVVDPKETVR